MKPTPVNWLKQHVDTVIVMSGILASFLWMQGKFSAMEDRINAKFAAVDLRFAAIDSRFAAIETRLTKIETIMIMQGIMHPALATRKQQEEKECLTN